MTMFPDLLISSIVPNIRPRDTHNGSDRKGNGLTVYPAANPAWRKEERSAGITVGRPQQVNSPLPDFPKRRRGHMAAATPVSPFVGYFHPEVKVLDSVTQTGEH